MGYTMNYVYIYGCFLRVFVFAINFYVSFFSACIDYRGDNYFMSVLDRYEIMNLAKNYEFQWKSFLFAERLRNNLTQPAFQFVFAYLKNLQNT
jgi:hypothetical protein